MLTVADEQGVSYYSDAKSARLLSLSEQEFKTARRASIFNNDAIVTSAILDRLLHRAETVIIEARASVRKTASHKLSSGLRENALRAQNRLSDFYSGDFIRFFPSLALDRWLRWGGTFKVRHEFPPGSQANFQDEHTTSSPGSEPMPRTDAEVSCGKKPGRESHCVAFASQIAAKLALGLTAKRIH